MRFISMCSVLNTLFQNIHTFTFQKYYFLQFCCLFLKFSKAFSGFLRGILRFIDFILLIFDLTHSILFFLSNLNISFLNSELSCSTSREILSHRLSIDSMRSLKPSEDLFWGVSALVHFSYNNFLASGQW